MADTPRSPRTGDHTRDGTGVEPDRGATTGTSRWQKAVGIIGLLVILWVGNQIASQLTGRGPGGMDDGPDRDAPPAEIQDRDADTEDGGGHRPPTGGRDH